MVTNVDVAQRAYDEMVQNSLRFAHLIFIPELFRANQIPKMNSTSTWPSCMLCAPTFELTKRNRGKKDAHEKKSIPNENKHWRFNLVSYIVSKVTQ